MKVYLDNIELKTLPLGLENIQEVIELDLTIHGYVRFFELPLTFIKDGFHYLNNLKKTNGFCGKVEMRIEVPSDQGTNIARGFLFLTDCSFNHTFNECEAEITDNTYGVFITESKELRISPLATVTRGNETLTPVTPANITIFTPSTGADLGTDAKMFEIADVAEHIVKYLSDNGLQFSQTYFGGTYDFYFSNSHFLVAGRGLNPDIQFSFKEMMEQGFKLWGMWFKIDNSTTPPTFNWIQGEENFFEDWGGITWSNIRELKEEFYPDRFFSTVDVGDPEAIIERGSTYQLPTVTLVGFKEETFNASNDCALENTLDLVSQWIIDTNKIEATLLTSEFNEKNVVIYADSTTGNAYKGTYGKDGVNRLYNEELLNYKVLNRHNIGTDLSQALGADVSSFKAYTTGDTTVTADGTTQPYPFDNEVSDVGNNYDNATYRYIAPSTGAYKFIVNLEYIVNSIQDDLSFGLDGNVTVTIRIDKRKTGTGAILGSKECDTVHISPSLNTYTQQCTAEFFLEATDYVDVRITWDFFYTGANNSITFKGAYADTNGDSAGSYFATVYTFNNGGTAQLNNLMDYKASALKFNGFPINALDWNSLKQNPSQGIHVNNGGGDSLCWIKRVARNIKTGESDCEMITSPILTQL